MNIHTNARTCPASRALLLERVDELGWSVTQAAFAAGVSDRRAHHWLKRGRCEGVAGLRDRSSRPHRSPSTTPIRQVIRMIELRLQGLTIAEIAAQVRPSAATVARLLKRVGLSRLSDLHPKPPPRRYEWARAGQLLHLDIKPLGRFHRPGKRVASPRGRSRNAGWDYVHVCIDDHSRVAYVEVLSEQTGVAAVGFLERAVAWFRELGVEVERVMTDNGSCYLSRIFRRACADLDIKHIRTRPYSPQTNGKAERFIQTLCREWAYVRPYKTSKARNAALPHWLSRYNHKRPHASVGGLPPFTRLPGRAA